MRNLGNKYAGLALLAALTLAFALAPQDLLHLAAVIPGGLFVWFLVQRESPPLPPTHYWHDVENAWRRQYHERMFGKPDQEPEQDH